MLKTLVTDSTAELLEKQIKNKNLREKNNPLTQVQQTAYINRQHCHGNTSTQLHYIGWRVEQPERG